MKIKTKIYIFFSLFGLIVIISGFVIYFTNQKVNRAAREDKSINDIVETVFELNIVTDDYLLNHRVKALIQWQAKYNHISNILETENFVGKEKKEIIRKIKDAHKDIKKSFVKLTEEQAPQKIKDKLVSQIAIRSQNMASGAFRLSNISSKEIVNAQKRANLLITIFFILMLTLVSVSAYIIVHAISVPLEKLKKGVEIVGKGNLEHKIDIETNDEMGELASAFNEMTVNLKRMTASRDELDREVSERKRTEKKLKQTVAELELSNKELEQFAYVSSHDLQEPLRKIQAFGDRLNSRYGDELEERGQEYLQRMQNAAGRMQTLINDLLNFSRITTKAKPFTEVDLNEIAQDILIDLETHIIETDGCVEVDELPTIDAEPTQIRQLFQNLISNALKYHKEDESPVVKIYSQKLDDEHCQIIIEDNGIGFDEKYLDRIFIIFQRLHGRFEYEGTGVGLAVCQKIVERHGGSITAKSEPGQGAKFIITLPVKQ